MIPDEEYSTFKYSLDKGRLLIAFSRPTKYNSIDIAFITELLDFLRNISEEDAVRVVIMTGMGKAFSCGYDLKWLANVHEEKYQESYGIFGRYFDLLETISTLTKPTVAKVNGLCLGAANGILGACDLVFSTEAATFGFNELKLGLVPAVETYFIMKRVEERFIRRLFLTGEQFPAKLAMKIGLVDAVLPHDKLDGLIMDMVAKLKSSSPNAVAYCKEMLAKLKGMDRNEAREYTSKLIAGLRISMEGEEGLTAVLEKRKPKWMMDAG